VGRNLIISDIECICMDFRVFLSSKRDTFSLPIKVSFSCALESSFIWNEEKYFASCFLVQKKKYDALSPLTQWSEHILWTLNLVKMMLMKGNKSHNFFVSFLLRIKYDITLFWIFYLLSSPKNPCLHASRGIPLCLTNEKIFHRATAEANKEKKKCWETSNLLPTTMDILTFLSTVTFYWHLVKLRLLW
jgi:hypothetical protein